MIWFNLIVGFLIGGTVGALIGNTNVFYRLNKTNLLGEMEEIGAETKRDVGGNILAIVVGFVFVVLGGAILMLGMTGSAFINNPSSTIGTVYTFGVICILLGGAAAFGAIKNLKSGQ